MSLLSDIINVERRYQRSINIVDDLASGDGLEGYIFPESAKIALLSMAEQIRGGQGSFTWTGPYGSGKSSLAVALAALVQGSVSDRENASQKLGSDWSTQLWELLNPDEVSWKVVPVVGSNEKAFKLIGDALIKNGVLSKSTEMSETGILEAIKNSIKNSPSPVILFIDEMGKTLEHVVQHAGDMFFYQQLAEIANRSSDKFVLIGVLHQALTSYASTLSVEAQKEWKKLSGRYIDISVDMRSDEQITLISKAISTTFTPSEKFKRLAQNIFLKISEEKKGFGSSMGATLENAWPLHPAVTCALGPMGRKGSGQNYRSVFSFLNSAEPAGFQEFINNNDKEHIFTLVNLWDYISRSQKGAILASSDGHKWAMAYEAIDRADSKGLGLDAIDCLKALTLLDWLKEGSGIKPNKENLSLCLEVPLNKIEETLRALTELKFITFKRYNGNYGLFEGSDFDIDTAITNAKTEIGKASLQNISDYIDLPTILAKKHYHETGTLRWVNFSIKPVHKIYETIENFKDSETSIARGIITFTANNESDDECDELLSQIRKNHNKTYELLIAKIILSEEVKNLFSDLESLRYILREKNEIAGDKIARRQIRERILHTTEIAKSRLHEAIKDLTFLDNQGHSYKCNWKDIGQLVDNLAKKQFSKAPYINSEILNREKPSAQANQGLKKLLYALLHNIGEEHLGIEGFPAERGLLEALLVSPGLYKQDKNKKWGISEPPKENRELINLWEDTSAYLRQKNNSAVNLQDIYNLWGSPPYGVSRGICPLYAFLYILNNWNKLAIYRQGLFRSEINEIDIDILLKTPKFIDLRLMNVSEEAKELLSELTDLAQNKTNENIISEPIHIAKTLIGIFDKLPSFAMRTQQVSKNARNVRSLFKSAHDPNKFLLEDIPSLKQFNTDNKNQSEAKNIAQNLRLGLEELDDAYPEVLRRLESIMLLELEVPNSSINSLKELKDRAENISGVSDDHIIEAFINRLAKYDQSHQSLESLVSLAAGKPTNNWIDADVKRAEIKISEFSRKFKHLESFANIKGRENKRTSMAIIVDTNTEIGPVEMQFNTLSNKSESIEKQAQKLLNNLNESQLGDRDSILSILAKASEKVILNSKNKFANEGE